MADLTRREVLASTAALATAPLVPPVPAKAITSTTEGTAAQACFRDGMAQYRHYTPAANAQAKACFLAAIQADPRFARAYALLAATERQAWTLGWTADRAAAHAPALQYASWPSPWPGRKLPHSRPAGGAGESFTLLYSQRHEEAAAGSRRSRCSLADVCRWLGRGADSAYRTQPGAALEKMARATALHVQPPVFYGYHIGLAHYVNGLCASGARPQMPPTPTRTLRRIRAARATNPDFRPGRIYLAATLWALGETAEARQEMEVIHAMGRIRTTNPAFAAVMREVNPFEDRSIVDHLIRAWQAAAAGEAV